MKTKIYLGGKHKKGSSRIDMELKETESGWCFSASGYYDYQYYSDIKGWDYTGCGQVISKIANLYPNNKDLLYDKEYNYPGQKQGYRYGSAWLYREIPKEDLQLIKKIIEKNGLE